MKQLFALALGLLGSLVLAACGGGSSAGSNRDIATGALSKNWQLTLADQTDSQGNDFTGGLSGGFFIQKGNMVSGSLAYSVALPGSPPCTGGSAAVSGTVSGQNVALSVGAGTQTFTLTGTLSADGTSITGNYATTAGPSLPGGGVCGIAQTGATWSAVAIPALSGSFQGNIHQAQVYTITGNLLQGPNVGASSATVTGELFSLDDPCFTHASLNGTISGSSVLLAVIADNGAVIGQIGQNGGAGTPLIPANFGSSSAGSGLVLRGLNGGGFNTTTKCPAGGGNLCLGTTAASCAQPVSFSLNSVAFPEQAVGTSRSQIITLTNTDPFGATQSGVLTFTASSSDFGFPPAPNFSEQDDCGTPQSLGTTPFSLAAGQSCSVTVTFSPQQSCSRGPNNDSNNPSNVPPLKCPAPLPQATLSATTLSSPDGNPTFSVNIAGTGVSAVLPLEAQLGFSAIAQGQTSAAQTATFVNASNSPVSILPAVPSASCVPGPITVPRAPGVVPGLQIVTQGSFTLPDTYACDIDSVSGLPNFPITADHCSGTTLDPGKSCTFDIAFAPQPGLAGANDLTSNDSDYFVQLSTLQCTTGVTSACEIDSGRFPIDIKWNNQSPLRISPNTGFDFGIQPIGADTIQNFTVFNDSSDPAFINPANPNGTTVEFAGLSTSSTGPFSQINTCGSSLAPGASCTISVTFHPTGTSLAQDIVVLEPKDPLSEGIAQNIFVWGRGQ